MKSCRGSKEASHAPRVKRDPCGSLHDLQSSSNVITLSLPLNDPVRVTILPRPPYILSRREGQIEFVCKDKPGWREWWDTGRQIPLNVSASAGADRNFHTFAIFPSGRASHQKATPHPEQGRCHRAQRRVSPVLILYCWRLHLSMDGILVSVVSSACLGMWLTACAQ